VKSPLLKDSYTRKKIIVKWAVISVQYWLEQSFSYVKLNCNYGTMKIRKENRGKTDRGKTLPDYFQSR